MNREQRKADRQYEREQRRAQRNTPERIALRQMRWQKAKQWLAFIPAVLRFFGIPVPGFSNSNLKNENNIFFTQKQERTFMKNFNASGFNPLSIILETLVRFFSRSPKYFRVLQWFVFIIGAALAVLNYAVAPEVVIDVFGPKGHEIVADAIKYLAGIYVMLKLPVEEKPAEATQ